MILSLIAASQTGDPLLDWLAQAGMGGVLAFVVVGFIRGWIVPGSHLTREREEKDRALDLVYAQAEIAQRALEAAERGRS
jgi:hypothetical protein